MMDAAGEWMQKTGHGTKWELQYSYAFHPGHQLRLQMENEKNGDELSYIRYTDYQKGEIGTQWTDSCQNTWERKTFASREDNVCITSLKSLSGVQASLVISVDDIARMSNEEDVGTRLADIRYRKVADKNGCYLGWIAHYPFYENSALNRGVAAGITRIFAVGKDAQQEYVFGSDTADAFVNPNGGAKEQVINVGGDKSPSVRISGAEAVYLITKTGRDTDAETMEAFVNRDNRDAETADGTAWKLIRCLLDDTRLAAEKYSTKEDCSDFDYEAALAPSARIHAEMFNRLSCSCCTAPEDIKMQSYTNEELIRAQQASKGKLLPAMLERLYENGRYACICASGIQAPRLGGMWTGAWGCQWSGDYTTDANINLQIAGANIGSLPEETIGFLNVMLKNVTDWQLNARQIYGIDDALLAPPRTDGDTAVLNHFDSPFPGQIWNAGAAWLLLPVYEMRQCYGSGKIALTDEIRKELAFTGNRYDNIQDCHGNTIIYNLRNTLELSDERAEQILQDGYFDLDSDILYPLLTKTANFWLGFADARYYTKDGKAYYEESHRRLADDEYWLLLPGYSPENKPSNTGEHFTANVVMDISAARSTMEMAVCLEKDLCKPGWEERTAAYAAYEKHLPPYLYESTGELKEWALWGYEETYSHRHGSQLYGLWPSYEAQRNEQLFAGAAKLIATKNTVFSTDNRSGHGWLHRALTMARLKEGAGVRDTLLPLVSNNMLYSSMMMAHNNDMTSAYCTDAVITIPAVELESLVYSDEDVIELLPALLPELAGGGCLQGTQGIHTRRNGTIRSLRWKPGMIEAVLKDCAGSRLLVTGDRLIVNGVDSTERIVADSRGICYYKVETDDESIQMIEKI